MRTDLFRSEEEEATDKGFSRRKTLLGLGALGVAGSGLPVASANQGRGNGNGAQSLDNEIVLDWVDAALETARRGLIIPTSGRVYAFLGTVMYDAVNGIHQARGEGFEAGDQYAVEPDVIPGACRVAALAGAANEILSRLANEELDDGIADDLVTGDDDFDGYDAILERQLEEYQDGNQEAGEEWGRQVAEEILNEREDAGADCESNFDVVDEKSELKPGMAQLADGWGSACLADLDPWGLPEQPEEGEEGGEDAIRAPEPPELDSLEFAVEYTRTRIAGNLDRDPEDVRTEVEFDVSEDRYDPEEAERLADGTYVGGAVEDEVLGYSDDLDYDEDEETLTLDIDPPEGFRDEGAFWAALPGTPQPEGRWLQVAKVNVRNEEPSFYETVRLYARLGIAVQDAGIVNWNNKRFYADRMGWRPHAATGTENQVPDSAADAEDRPDVSDIDNPDLVTEKDWEAISGWSPAPEYASGLTTVSTTSQRLLEDEFGDVGQFEVIVETADGETINEEYDSLRDARDQAAKSRVWSGRHYAAAQLGAIEMADDIVDVVLEAI